MSRPSLLITDAYNALRKEMSRKVQRAELIGTYSSESWRCAAKIRFRNANLEGYLNSFRTADKIRSVLRAGGDVLLPVDASTRVLEMALMLEEYWAQERLSSYELIFLSPVCKRVMDRAGSMLEWMSPDLSKTFSHQKGPFEFRYVRTLSVLFEMLAKPGHPTLILFFPFLGDCQIYEILRESCRFGQSLWSKGGAGDKSYSEPRSRPGNFCAVGFQARVRGSFYQKCPTKQLCGIHNFGYVPG
jgi:hypothetical protein